MEYALDATQDSEQLMIAVKMPGGVTRWIEKPVAIEPISTEPRTLRSELGIVLREHRFAQGATLRQIAAKAMISLGYISEVERGKKEPSSEILNYLCLALGTTLATVLRQVAERLEPTGLPEIPDTIENLFGGTDVCRCVASPLPAA